MAKLTIHSNDSEKSYELQSKTTIGRLANNTIAIDDTKSSRQNSLIFLHSGHYYIRDLKSRNGTMVNGDKIEKDRQLVSGDRVKVGNTIFIFSEEEDPNVTVDLVSLQKELQKAPQKPKPKKPPVQKTPRESNLQKGIRQALDAKSKSQHKKVQVKKKSLNERLESLNRNHVLIIMAIFMCILFLVARWLTLSLIG